MTQKQRTTPLYDQLEHVEFVRSRMCSVNEAQQEFITYMNEIKDPSVVNWVDYLNRFNIFLSKHVGFSNTFIESNLRKIVVHPKEIPPPEQDEKISFLLRTKRIPEIEEEEERIKHNVSIEEDLYQDEKDAIVDMNDETKWDKLLNEWMLRYSEHAKVASTASEVAESVVGEINTKFRVEDDSNLTSEETGSQGDLTLEKVLSFMSSGTQ
ncbi:mediator of RNA polymerase II transcription subunit 8 [Gigaspora margarita]|uniref:Mediator of RNA polymerase II transcription subunit 8 n=1 Tax=Gigaspora margarita TaxID=4874 RepID=A0A8H4EH30_GIGMA|nr:mediator of RNA polymerase II transcription subunit 8 [Gigaspora margarita]